MAMTDPEAKPNGPLARLGQNDSAAGLSRLGIGILLAALGAIFAWGGHDLGVMFDRLNENQRAIVALGDRTTRVEDAAANARDAATAAQNSSKDFRIWTEGRVNDLTSQINAEGRQIDQVDRSQAETTNRVRCLENRTRCPP